MSAISGWTTVDAGLALAGARLVDPHPAATAWLWFAAQSNLTKALPFAPWLAVAWCRGGAAERERVLMTPVASALALAATWLVTGLWQRPRPLHPEAGLEPVAAAFGGLAAENPGWLYWGCFPSDHAAYLTALGLGLFVLDRRLGATALTVGVGVCGGARLAVGLHYASDLLAGVAAGVLAHRVVSGVLLGRGATALRHLRARVEASACLQLALFLAIVEMAVMFQDLRGLDRLLFPLSAGP